MVDFDRFVNDSTDGLLRTAYLIVWDLHDAEDLVQETLFKVARRWRKVRRMDRPLAYARRILVNQALDGSQRRARARAELVEAQAPDAAIDSVDPGDHDELLRALKDLPPRQRAVLVLRFFLDLPEAEVAAAMGVSLGTVKSTTSRGLARLEQTLSNDTRSIA
ncbi:MAG TPA: SigE family RNA polymerase sigma factor [Solirubrobacteraceae bacterium]|jgi:RNA polymerase sigma-70 factor (sigma-E family)|nr:SigE family RNA polymerase sigma factor [Solirubrobacteraceae bacterium]